MKYKVLGWVSYDDIEIEDGEITIAKINAVIEEIKNNGYLFSGWHHQEYLDCAPLLNDGKKLTFSQRGFGEIMARAYGYFGEFDYSKFAFDYCINPTNLNFPKGGYDESQIENIESLREIYTIEINENTLREVIMNNFLVINNILKLKYIDNGDFINIKTELSEYIFEVTGVKQEKISKNSDKINLVIAFQEV